MYLLAVLCLLPDTTIFAPEKNMYEKNAYTIGIGTGTGLFPKQEKETADGRKGQYRTGK
jgi:hypothetical protein